MPYMSQSAGRLLTQNFTWAQTSLSSSPASALKPENCPWGQAQNHFSSKLQGLECKSRHAWAEHTQPGLCQDLPLQHYRQACYCLLPLCELYQKLNYQYHIAAAYWSQVQKTTAGFSPVRSHSSNYFLAQRNSLKYLLPYHTPHSLSFSTTSPLSPLLPFVVNKTITKISPCCWWKLVLLCIIHPLLCRPASLTAFLLVYFTTWWRFVHCSISNPKQPLPLWFRSGTSGF